MVRTRVGFTGGTTDNATYRNIADHTEAVEVEFDPAMTDYPALLALFWSGHDPTVPAHSRQYMSAIFCHGVEQLRLARDSMVTAQAGSKKPITTLVLPAGQFYQAEDYHQKYILQKHPQLLQSLRLARGPALVSSSLAARLNGYLGGHGSREGLLGERETLAALSQQDRDYVLEAMAEVAMPSCGL